MPIASELVHPRLQNSMIAVIAFSDAQWCGIQTKKRNWMWFLKKVDCIIKAKEEHMSPALSQPLWIITRYECNTEPSL